MIDPEHEMLVDLRTSCTRQVAASKLLGWMRGPTYRRYIQVTEHGTPVDQKPFLSSIDASLAEQLSELLEASRNEYIDAIEADATAEICDNKLDDFFFWEEKIKMAAQYLQDIDDELDKDEASALRIDKLATEQSGVVHLTHASIDLWACRKYGFSIFEPPTCQLENATVTTPAASPEGDSPDPKGGLRRTSADSLYTSFYFLVEAYSRLGGEDYRHLDGRPKVEAIATLIHERAKETNKGKNLPGQSEESVKGRIEAAEAKNRSTLLSKGNR